LTLLLRVLTNNILPAFVVIAIGFTLERALRPDLQSISRLALYALSPALVFSSLVTSQLQGGMIATLASYAVAVTFAMVVISFATARLLRLDQATTSAFVLSTALVNSGNFGFSVVSFAYGEAGLQLAIIYFVTSAVMANTIGAFIASRSHGSWRDSLRGVLRLPLIYASAFAILFRLLDYVPPSVIMRPITTIG